MYKPVELFPYSGETFVTIIAQLCEFAIQQYRYFFGRIMMPGKSKVPVVVNFNLTPVACNPDPVTVKRTDNDGIQWTANVDGYTFTGVKVDGIQAPTGDFGTPAITTNPAGRSVMSVPDSVADIKNYTYTLEYRDAAGNTGTYDPTIRNTQ